MTRRTGPSDTNPSHLPYAIYARQSSDREGSGLAIARQVRECRELADKLRLGPEPTVYPDNDISASTGKRRPQYERLLDAMRSGKHDALVVWHTDRLHRRPIELEEFINVVEAAGVRIYTVKAGELDLANPSGRATARTLSAWARYEVEQKGARQKTSNRQKAQRGGRVSGGPRPFGYGRTISEPVVDEDGQPVLDPATGEAVTRRIHLDRNKINRPEAAAIKSAFERKLRGDSDASIYKSWNDRGLRTSRGNEWVGTSFREMMQRPSLAGIVVYLGEEQRDEAGNPVSSEWPAIVEVDEWRAVQTIMSDPERKTSPGPRVRHLLGGLTYCQCGLKMKSGVIGTYTNGRNPVYKCSSSKGGHSTILRSILEPYVRERVIDALLKRQESPAARAPEDEALLARLNGELGELREAQKRLARAIARDLITEDDAHIESVANKGRIKRLRADIDDINRSSAESAILDDSIATMFMDAAEAPEFGVNEEGEPTFNFSGSFIKSMERDEMSRAEAVRFMVDWYWSRNTDKDAFRTELGRRFDALDLEAKRNLIRSLVEVTVARGQGEGSRKHGVDRLDCAYL